MKYDYLIVGAGLYGAVFAHEAKKAGRKVLVIDRRSHIAGNVYTEEIAGINVHKYGAHIFHTNNKEVWQYVNQFAGFNRFTNSPVANYRGELYSLPFNMYTFNKMWGVVTPEEAAAKIEEQRQTAGITDPKNLEEQAISLVGTDIYEKLVKGYTEKQWGRPCSELPAFIIKRLPVRLTFDNNYFNALYQGIPEGGYTKLVSNMLEGVEVNGKQMYLSNFGINTLNYFISADNEKNAYHIDGDPDDENTSGNADKLKSMIANDPDTVVSFFTQLSQKLSDKMFDLMKSKEGYSSAMTVYDDKKMQTDYDDYTAKIKELEKKLADYEDKWYAKFAAMETALAKMQNNASAVTSLLGG